MGDALGRGCRHNCADPRQLGHQKGRAAPRRLGRNVGGHPARQAEPEQWADHAPWVHQAIFGVTVAVARVTLCCVALGEALAIERVERISVLRGAAARASSRADLWALLSADGRWLDGNLTVAEAGLHDRDVLTALAVPRVLIILCCRRSLHFEDQGFEHMLLQSTFVAGF